jgi:hypothetical protein
VDESGQRDGRPRAGACRVPRPFGERGLVPQRVGDAARARPRLDRLRGARLYRGRRAVRDGPREGPAYPRWPEYSSSGAGRGVDVVPGAALALSPSSAPTTPGRAPSVSSSQRRRALRTPRTSRNSPQTMGFFGTTPSATRA